MLPINMFLPICIYSAVLIPLACLTYIPKEPECYQHPGNGYYNVAIALVFITFVVQLFTEIMTFLVGLRGGSSSPGLSSIRIKKAFS